MRFILSFLTSILAVSTVQSASVRTDYSQEIQDARSLFNSQLLTYLDHQSNGKNILVSSFGLHSVLSSVLAGAEARTFEQLWNGLG